MATGLFRPTRTAPRHRKGFEPADADVGVAADWASGSEAAPRLSVAQQVAQATMNRAALSYEQNDVSIDRFGQKTYLCRLCDRRFTHAPAFVQHKRKHEFNPKFLTPTGKADTRGSQSAQAQAQGQGQGQACHRSGAGGSNTAQRRAHAVPCAPQDAEVGQEVACHGPAVAAALQGPR